MGCWNASLQVETFLFSCVFQVFRQNTDQNAAFLKFIICFLSNPWFRKWYIHAVVKKQDILSGWTTHLCSVDVRSMITNWGNVEECALICSIKSGTITRTRCFRGSCNLWTINSLQRSYSIKEPLPSSSDVNSNKSNYWSKPGFAERWRFQKHKTLDDISVLADVDNKKPQT